MSTAADVVRATSGAFRAAVQRGDCETAQLLGKRIMHACQEYVAVSGAHAARNGWAARLGLPWAPVDQHEALHFERVAHAVSLTLQGMGIDSVAVPRVVPPADDDIGPMRMVDVENIETTAAADWHAVHAGLTHVSALYTAIAQTLQRAGPLVAALDARIDGVERDVDVSTDALLRYYNASSSGHRRYRRAVWCLPSDTWSAALCIVVCTVTVVVLVIVG